MPADYNIREIPAAEWAEFADQFSRLHQGQRATTETFACGQSGTTTASRPSSRTTGA